MLIRCWVASVLAERHSAKPGVWWLQWPACVGCGATAVLMRSLRLLCQPQPVLSMDRGNGRAMLLDVCVGGWGWGAWEVSCRCLCNTTILTICRVCADGFATGYATQSMQTCSKAIPTSYGPSRAWVLPMPCMAMCGNVSCQGAVGCARYLPCQRLDSR